MKEWRVYLLLCRDWTYYCGCTNDLERRVKAHNAGKGAKFTRGRLPVILIASKAVVGRGDALRLEAAVKRLPWDRKIAALT